jgi:hypothetical protein
VDCPNTRPRRAQNRSLKRTPTKQTASEKGLLSTPCGDIQQKNRHAIFSGVETSMKMTFHSFDRNLFQTRERRGSLSKPPLLFFHYENVFRKKRTAKPRQTQSHLTPMITSQISPENQITKAARRCKPPFKAERRLPIWSLVIEWLLGHWCLEIGH